MMTTKNAIIAFHAGVLTMSYKYSAADFATDPFSESGWILFLTSFPT